MLIKVTYPNGKVRVESGYSSLEAARSMYPRGELPEGLKLEPLEATTTPASVPSKPASKKKNA